MAESDACTADALREELAAAGQRLAAASAERDAAMAALGDVARRANGTVPIMEIAELGGVDSPEIQQLIELTSW